MKNFSRALVIVIVLGVVIQIGSVLAQTALSGTASVTSDDVNTDISQEVLNKLNGDGSRCIRASCEPFEKPADHA